MRHEAGRPTAQNDALLLLFEKSEPSLAELPATRSLLEIYVGMCAALLKEVASMEVKVVLDEFKQGPPRELISVDVNAVSAIGFIPEWNEHAVCQIDRLLLFRILDAMFGGDPSARTTAPDRPLTSLERSVVLRLTRELMARLSAAMLETCPFTFRSERVVDDGDFGAAHKSRSEFLLCRLKVAEFQDHVVIAIPVVGLELARERLAVEPTEEEIDLDPAWTQAFRRNIGSTSIRLVASVDGPEMLLSDVAKLRPGSMLEFEGSRLQRVLIESEDKSVFVGRLGQSQGVFTICVEKPASPRGGNDNAA